MANSAIDPITTEVIRNALNSAAEEMNATLFRSAYTWIICELRDCSVALLDADHRVLGQSSGLPIFLGNLEVCTKLTEETYGRDVWQLGDVWALNDSYLAATHLNDVTVFSPIFHKDVLIGFSASRAHWLRRRREVPRLADGLDRHLARRPSFGTDQGRRPGTRAARHRPICSGATLASRIRRAAT